jgi:hypothetical protein
MIVVAMGCY